MRRKSIMRLVIIGLALISIGCSHLGGVGKTSPVLDRIQKRGAVMVGTAGSMPPLNMITRNGLPAGLDVDLAQYIAGAMGVKLELITKNFADLLPALETGEVDMVISGMTITPTRNLKFAFAGPYHITGKAILTQKATLARITDPHQMNSTQNRVVALADSTSVDVVRETMPEAKLITVASYDDGIAMLIKNQADAMVSDYHACLLAMLRYPDAGFIAGITPFTYEPLGIAIPAGDSHLLNWLDNFIGTMDGADELIKLKTKWISDGSWIDQLP